MNIVHFGHSCVLVEKGASKILIDPGSFSSDFEGQRDLSAVLITHKHPDHLDPDRLPSLLAANPSAQLITDTESALIVRELGLSPTVAQAGDAFEFGELALNVVGGEHATIHPDLPAIANIGYIVNHGAFYHPGDSFFIPKQRIDILALPTCAPWLKGSEAVEFLRAVAPRVAIPIHQGLLAKPAPYYNLFTKLAPQNTEFRTLPHATPNPLTPNTRT